MKKILLLLFILPFFAEAQTNTTPQFKRNIPADSLLGYSIPGLTGNHWLPDTAWVKAHGGGGSGGGTTTHPLTVNSSGIGDASSFIFNGSVARTISWNSIGALPVSFPSNQTITQNGHMFKVDSIRFGTGLSYGNASGGSFDQYDNSTGNHSGLTGTLFEINHNSTTLFQLTGSVSGNTITGLATTVTPKWSFTANPALGSTSTVGYVPTATNTSGDWAWTAPASAPTTLYTGNGTITGNRMVTIGTTYVLTFSTPNGSLAMSELFGNPNFSMGSTDTGSGADAYFSAQSGQVKMYSQVGGSFAGISTDLGANINVIDDINSNGLLYDKHMNYAGLQQIPDVQMVDSLITAGGAGVNIYNTDGTFTAARTGKLNGNALTIYDDLHSSVFFNLTPSATTPTVYLGTANATLQASNTGIALAYGSGGTLKSIIFDNGTTNGVTLNDANNIGFVYGANYTANQRLKRLSVPSVNTVIALADSVKATISSGGITALTGDATASGTGSVPITFATVNSTTGSFGDATHVPVVTVNGKGLTTAATSTAITFPVTPANSVALTNKDLTGTGNTFPTFNQNTTGTSSNITSSSNSTITTLSALSLPYSQLTGAPTSLSGTGYPKFSGSTPTFNATIPNADLTNSSTTINGTTISLGAAGTITAAATTLTGSALASGVTGSSLTSFGSSPTLNTPVITGLPTGTGISSSAIASTINARDANANIFFNNDVPNSQTIVSSTTPIVLTNASPKYLIITGTVAQTITFPVASTMSVAQGFVIWNQTNQTATAQSSGANIILSIISGLEADITCALNSGTTAASWDKEVKIGGYTGTGGYALNTNTVLSGTTSMAAATSGVIAITVANANALVANSTGVGSATNTQAVIFRNGTVATSGVPVQNNGNIDLRYNVWNTSGTPATNQVDWLIQGRATSSSAPGYTLVFGSSLGTGTISGTDRMSLDQAGNLVMLTGTVQLHGYTVSSLPTGVTGMTAYVTDALTPSFGVTLVGGGAIVTKAFYNGTNWIAE